MFGVILLPNFALQTVLRHQPEIRLGIAVALLGDDAGGNTVIFQCNATARKAGVQVGMTSSQGLGRCGSLRLLTRSLEQETTVATALLESAFSCSPWVEATTNGVCTFELRHARSDPQSLAGRVLEHLARLDLEARVGFAANADLAFLAAHAAEPSLVVHDARAFLADLPVRVLDPSPHAAAILKRWGIGTLGALGALPPQELARRLGPEGRALWDRANGRSQRLLRLASLPVTYEESLEFEYEVQSLKPLLFVLRRFLDQLEVNHRAPVQVTSGTIKGSVRGARGPYQLLGGWWGPEGWTCEEWDVELAHGGLYRVSRQPEGWFLEGTYD